jgi:hypothetical protein
MAEIRTKKWKFFRAGGVDQVVLESGADILHLDDLDPKLWVALSMPTRGVDIDPRTLDLLDLDHDGHVRHPEVLSAIAWVRDAYAQPDELFKGGDSVALSALKDGPIKASARRLLTAMKKDTSTITLADVIQREAVLNATTVNGDGVFTPEDSIEGDARALIEAIIATHGSVNDRSGKAGVDKARIDAFFAEVRTLLAWRDALPADATPLGAATEAAAEAVKAVAAKIDDYFTRCRLVAFDPRAGAVMGGTDADFLALAPKSLSATSPDVAALPLARIEPKRALPLDDTVNPAWVAAIATFSSAAVTPMVGARTSLGEGDWHVLQYKLASFEAHRASKPATKVEALGLDKLRAIVAGGGEQALAALLNEDLAIKPEVDGMIEVERLCRYQRDLLRLLRNYVNFSEFYARKGAVFQAGTLYLDGRGCDLVVEVADAGKHGALAPMAGAYLAYCDCVNAKGDKRSIAAAFTNGDSDNLIAGRNGVFFDRGGGDWEATIVKIVDNPISIRQAFWAPYKKFARMIEAQVAKRASAADAEAQAKLEAAAAATANADKTAAAAAAPAAPAPAAAPAAAAAPAPPDKPKSLDLGTIAAIGVAVGGIGTFVGALLSSVFGLGAWMPIGLVLLFLMISGPSMLLAYLKLRTRNLGPLLDANGWAINGRARINVPFGAALTEIAELPPGSQRSGRDPYAEKGRPWKLYMTIVIVLGLALGWYVGKLDKYLPKSARSTSVLGDAAPAAEKKKADAPAPAPEKKADAPAPAPAPAATK